MWGTPTMELTTVFAAISALFEMLTFLYILKSQQHQTDESKAK